ncbi:unnamed protein product [Kuraishia capsulata CBS 1993]|uniref:Pre-mRNA-splicing factor SYF2 n=1 Tax=Kuraishia capsulata CBS 1993 TaxID=1382522 RepID=W6ML64_9ASCO|nr:uncharacterized protein KUCA_T00003207001 [Kuraishia capsulata CBS 1993]CDK27229.1 unnamed protein product [Kuraishia capsulata CBS 1993]
MAEHRSFSDVRFFQGIYIRAFLSANTTMTDLTAKERLAKLKELKSLKRQSADSNRKELLREHQQKKVDAKVRLRLEEKQKQAEEELVRLESEDRGEDHDRRKAWDWSIEDVERWDAKQKRDKHRKSQAGFQNYVQMAERAYEKDLEDKPVSIKSHNDQMEQLAERLEQGQDYDKAIQELVARYRPSKDTVEGLVANLAAANERRMKRNRPVGENDSGFINDKNRQFNDKLSRHYDKYTRDIQEALERGSAL